MRLPLTHDLDAGAYYLIAVTDAGGAVLESSDSNNLAVSDPFTITFPALPDPAVAGDIGVSVPSTDSAGNPVARDPSILFPGMQVDVAWTVRNLGTAAMAGAWREAVYLSGDATAGDADDLLLCAFAYSGSIAAGGSAARTQKVEIPVTGFTGDAWIVVKVDSEDAQSPRRPTPTTQPSRPRLAACHSLSRWRPMPTAWPRTAPPCESS